MDFSEIRITLVVKVKDVISGEMIDLNIPGPYLYERLSDDICFRAFYDTIRRFEMHEVDEHFYIDGIKVHDPHKADPPLVNVPQIFDVSETTLASLGKDL